MKRSYLPILVLSLSFLSPAASFAAPAHTKGGQMQGMMALEQLQASIEQLSLFEQTFQNWDQIADIVTPDGVNYKEAIVAVDQNLSKLGFYISPSLDWMNQKGTQMLRQPLLVRKASLTEIRQLLGGITRVERMTSGLMGKAILDQVYRNAYLRLLEITAQ